MKNKLLISTLIIILIALVNPFSEQKDSIYNNVERVDLRPTQKGKKKTLEERTMFSEARLLHEYYRQVNPITGEISKADKADELKQAQEANIQGINNLARSVESSYINRGPTNLGGRTRSLVIDRSDTSGNTMLAGAVSGGVFRTTNGGASWDKVSSNDEIHNVTTIVQDPRTGFDNIWYYGTGESYISVSQGSQSSGAFYLGQGIWKSMDGGQTWTQMPSTASPQDQVDVFDLMLRLAVHPTTGDLYMAGLGRVLRFDGTSWFTEIDNGTGIWTDEETDIVFTTSGRAYAAFSGGNENVKGIWTSPNGIGNWSLINTGFFEPEGRVVLALAPSNQNKLYTLFVNGNTASCGSAAQEADLWLWDQSTQDYVNYTNILPDEGGCPPIEGTLTVQGGWDLCLAVKPDDENFVVIGGTSAYKKEDITDSSSRFQKIGGYGDSEFGFYDEGTGVVHHPDIQYLVFNQNSPDILFSATDAGVHRTDNVSAPVVGWQDLNNNYQTYQFYHVDIDPLTGSDIVIGGSQDNGTTVGGTGFGLPDLSTQLQVAGGDGVAVGFSRDQDACFGFVGFQLGPIIRGTCDQTVADEITPTGSTSQFVTYFYLDPDNNNTLYYAGQNTLFRTTDASNVTSGTWDNLGTTAELGTFDWFQTFSTTRGNYNPTTSYLLMGGDEGKIFKLNDPWNATNITQSIDITPPTATLGFPSIVTGLAIHPTNSDIVLATYANYGTESIFLTTNATSNTPTWTLVEQNLSAHSIRSAAITEVDGEILYFVGTARGLYSNSDPTTDDWVREAPDQIGFALVSSLVYRPSDNHLLIGTHGNGMYEATLTGALSVNAFEISDAISLYPNPTVDELHIKLQDNFVLNKNCTIKNNLGQTVLKGQLQNNSLKVTSLQSGMYFIQLEVNGKYLIRRFIKK